MLCLIAFSACQKQSLTFPFWQLVADDVIFQVLCNVLQSLNCPGWVWHLPYHNLRKTLPQSTGHPVGTEPPSLVLWVSVVPEAPSQHYLLCSPMAAGRTSSPKRRKMTCHVHAHHQRTGSSVRDVAAQWELNQKPGWPHSFLKTLPFCSDRPNLHQFTNAL